MSTHLWPQTRSNQQRKVDLQREQSRIQFWLKRAKININSRVLLTVLKATCGFFSSASKRKKSIGIILSKSHSPFGHMWQWSAMWISVWFCFRRKSCHQPATLHQFRASSKQSHHDKSSRLHLAAVHLQAHLSWEVQVNKAVLLHIHLQIEKCLFSALWLTLAPFLCLPLMIRNVQAWHRSLAHNAKRALK